MAVNSEVDIYNLALNAIGARDNVSLPDENSREAEVCRLWFSPVLDQVLSAAPWPEATKTAYLGLIDERDFGVAWAPTNARPEFAFAYTVPSDLIRPQYLSSYARFAITAYPGDVRALVTNQSEAILTYTQRLEKVTLWSSSFQMAVVYGLAMHIAMPLTGRNNRIKAMRDSANELLYTAREVAANTSNEHFDVLPEWLAARGYASGVPTPQYVYPFGEVFSGGAGAV